MMAQEGASAFRLTDLIEIDQQTFNKAGTILDEARSRARSFDYDLAVRRAQEAFELHLKSLFRFLHRTYPETHDLKKQIYELSVALNEFSFDSRQVARLVLANSMLALWRSPAFYGDETLKVGGLFDASEANLAISYAESAQLACEIVRQRAYAQATTAAT
jgi:HEPN domain-containing protein